MWNLLNVFEYLVLRKWWRFIFEFEVWEWCKNVWYWNEASHSRVTATFENDVKTYGTETHSKKLIAYEQFENDVKTYGTETPARSAASPIVFENDVKTYGTETIYRTGDLIRPFENDVKTYGTETASKQWIKTTGLRMM